MSHTPLRRDQVIDRIPAASKNPAEIDIAFAEQIQAAAISALLPPWQDAYAAFRGAFDTPVARRQDASVFANDARTRMRAFNDGLSGFTLHSMAHRAAADTPGPHMQPDLGEVTRSIEQALEALHNAPQVGEVYDQQHSDTHVRAILQLQDVLSRLSADSTPEDAAGAPVRQGPRG